MNYIKQYDTLINRAKNRTLNGYKENHHIMPKCIGGDNSKDNIAILTAREHFIAHLLLIKIYPNEPKLIYAVNSMCRFNKKMDRSKNRMYGWLRKLFAEAVSGKQAGKKNSQYGTCWISLVDEKKSKKIKIDELNYYLENGWIRGRNKKYVPCNECKTPFIKLDQKVFCSGGCMIKSRTRKNKAIKRPNIVNKNFTILYSNYIKYGSVAKAFEVVGIGITKSVYDRFYREIKKRNLTAI